MALLYNDNFTDTNGTQIQNHTADSGQSYSTNAGFKIQDNRLYCDDITNRLVEVLDASIAPFLAFEMVFRKVTDAGNLGAIIGDTGVGVQSGYYVRVGAGQSLQLYKATGGGLLLQDSYTFSYSDGTDFTVRMEITEGSLPTNRNVRVLLDGIERMSLTNDTHTYNDRIFYRQPIVASSTTGYHLDSVQYSGETPPYPVASYTVDVDGTETSFLQQKQAPTGQTYGINQGAKLDSGRLYFDSLRTTAEIGSVIRVQGAQCDVEYDIDLDIYRHTDAGNVGIIFGSDSTLQSGFMLRATTSSAIQLWEIIGGGFNFRDTYTHSTGNGASLPAIKAEVRSGQIEVFVGGVSRFTHVNAINKEGDLYFRGNVNLTSTTGYHLDSVTYTAVTNGANGPLLYNDTFTTEAAGAGAGTLEVVDFVASGNTEAPAATHSGTFNVFPAISTVVLRRRRLEANQ